MKEYKATGRHCNNTSYSVDCNIKQRQALKAKMATVEKSNKTQLLGNLIFIIVYSY